MTDRALANEILKLSQIGLAFHQETNISRLLSLIVREIMVFTGAHLGRLYVLSEAGLKWKAASRRVGADVFDIKPADDTADSDLSLRLTHPLGFVALTGKSIIIEDVSIFNDCVPYTIDTYMEPLAGDVIRSLMIAPLKATPDRVIGVIQLINASGSSDPSGSFSPFQAAAVHDLSDRAAQALESTARLADSHELFSALVQYSASAIDARSPHTAGHSRRVAAICVMLARAVNNEIVGPLANVSFSPAEIDELSYAAWLHDIGKIGVPESILEKRGKLSPTRLDALAARADRIRLALTLTCQAKIIDLYESGRYSPEAAAELMAEQNETSVDLEASVRFIRLASFNDAPSEEDFAYLEQIASRKYTDENGQPIRLLNEVDLENLRVRSGNLTSAEYEEIKAHVIYTKKILDKIPFTPELARVPEFVAAHHEKLDGSGYPLGLKGDAIPIQARIIGVADLFDALAAGDRPYRDALPAKQALDILKQEAELGRLDKHLVNLFIKAGIADDERARAKRGTERLPEMNNHV